MAVARCVSCSRQLCQFSRSGCKQTRASEVQKPFVSLVLEAKIADAARGIQSHAKLGFQACMAFAESFAAGVVQGFPQPLPGDARGRYP